MTDVFQATHDLLARTVDSPASFAFQLLPSAFQLLPSAFQLLPSAFQLLPSSDCIDFQYDKRGDDQQICFCAG
jgi:hypothetical protein